MAILVTVMMTVLLGVVALVVDVGVARDQLRESQAAVDSAALAAAMVMHENDSAPSARSAARDRATAYLLANYWPPVDRLQFTSDWNACTSCLTFTDTSVTVSLAPLPAADVHSPSFFGGVYGATGYNTAVTATATWSQPLPGDCLLCVTGDARFDDSSRGVGVVDGGNAKIGGGLDIQYPGSLTVRSGDVLRGWSVHGQPTVDGDHQVLPLTTFADPYAGSPAHDPWSVLGSPSDVPAAQYDATARSCHPPSGSTVAAITAADASTCPGFDSGMYVIHPGGNVLFPPSTTSSYAVTPVGGGMDVLFFLTCRSGSAPAPCSPYDSEGAYLSRIGESLTLKGITSASGVLGQFRGFAIILDRNDTGLWYHGSHDNILGSTMNGDLVVYGNVYLPTQHLIANDRTTVYGQVVAGGDLDVGSGLPCTSTCLTVRQPTVVGAPTPLRKVHLLASP